MALQIKHKYLSPIPDADTPDIIKPSHWNDTHEITLSSNKIIGRASEGIGAAEEIDCTAIARQILAAANAAAIRAIIELGGAALFDEASAGDFIAAVSGKLLSADKVWSAAELQEVDYGSTITLDLSEGLNFEITLEGSPVLANPQNAKSGQSGVIVINTGGNNRSIIYGSAWKAPGGPLDLSAEDTTDYLFYFVKDSSNILYTILNDPE